MAVKTPYGRILKTDLYDKAAIPFHPMADLVQHGSAIVGLDISWQVLFRSRKNIPSQCALVLSDVRTLPFKTGCSI